MTGSLRWLRGRVALGTLVLTSLIGASPARGQDGVGRFGGTPGLPSVVLPGAVGTFNTSVSQNVFVFPASATVACGTASITAVPLPVVEVVGTNCADGLQAILNYSFVISGPASASVPLRVGFRRAAEAADEAQAGYSLSVAGQTLLVDNCAFFRLTGCGTLEGEADLTLNANQVYGVTMMAIVINNLGPGRGAVLLDPRFSFAPGFDATGYSLAFSPGIGNGGASVVPEPGVQAMTLLGLAGLAAWRRRRAT